MIHTHLKASARRYALPNLPSFGTDTTSLVPYRLLIHLFVRFHDMHEDC
jgi:hypothetical protein